MYMQSFSCEINCTKVRLQQNYTKVQMRQIGPGVGVSFKRDSYSRPLGGISESVLWTLDQQFRLGGVFFLSVRLCPSNVFELATTTHGE